MTDWSQVLYRNWLRRWKSNNYLCWLRSIKYVLFDCVIYVCYIVSEEDVSLIKKNNFQFLHLWEIFLICTLSKLLHTLYFLKKKHFRLTPNCGTKSNGANEQAWWINENAFPKVVRPLDFCLLRDWAGLWHINLRNSKTTFIFSLYWHQDIVLVTDIQHGH